jgi:hypothetical protein
MIMGYTLVESATCCSSSVPLIAEMVLIYDIWHYIVLVDIIHNLTGLDECICVSVKEEVRGLRHL